MPSFGELIVGLSGQAGSGKSTLAQFLASRLDGETASFGDFVRHLAALQGASTDRRSLQEIGEAAVRDGAESFVAKFVAWATPSQGRAFIVDGIRHIAIDEAMRAWAATISRTYVALMVTANDDVRADRRTTGDRAALAMLDAHPVEQETVTALPTVADLVVQENWDGEALLESILKVAFHQ
jgi:dephospho-CoA kinase